MTDNVYFFESCVIAW